MTKETVARIDTIMLFVWISGVAANAVHHNWPATIACLAAAVLSARLIDMQRHPQP